MINTVRKDIWINSYPIFLWLALEPIVGLIDSKIASVINLDTLSAIGIGETIYFVFIWVFIFLGCGSRRPARSRRSRIRRRSGGTA